MITKEEYQKTLIRMWDSVREDPDAVSKLNCDGVACRRCPINDVCSSGMGEDICDAANVFDLIDAVEEWGKEHSIKTNRKVFTETLQEKFGDTFNIPKLMSRLEDTCLIYSGSCPDDCVCGDCDQCNFWDREYKEVSKDADSN